MHQKEVKSTQLLKHTMLCGLNGTKIPLTNWFMIHFHKNGINLGFMWLISWTSYVCSENMWVSFNILNVRICHHSNINLWIYRIYRKKLNPWITYTPLYTYTYVFVLYYLSIVYECARKWLYAAASSFPRPTPSFQ